MNRTTIKVAFCVALAITATAGCWSPPRTIEFIVRDGFRGPFIIVERERGQSGAFRDGKLTLIVPPSGIVEIDDDSAFYEMTLRSARYASGEILPIDHEFDASLVALRGGGHSSGMRGNLHIPPHYSYFVGTEEEFFNCDFSDLERQIAVSR